MRPIIPTLTAAAVALALAGCGSSSAGETAATAEDKAFDGALKFARCMRGEGIDFPDPERGSNGTVRIGPGRDAQLDPRDKRVQEAQRKCQKHLDAGGGEAPDAEQQAKFQDAFLAYARCMRREGVNVPDPKPGQGGGGIVFQAGDPNGPDLDSPRFKAADRKCQPALAELDDAVRETP